MRLSNFEGLFYKVKKDCQFATLAKLSDQIDKKFICFIESEKYFYTITKNDNVVGVICSEKLFAEHPELEDIVTGLAISENPKASFFSLHNYLVTNSTEYVEYDNKDTYIDETAIIDPSAKIAVKDVYIGRNVHIEENVIIRQGVEIGAGSIIRTGAILGGTNENNFYDFNGNFQSVVHSGKVRIGENVVIGSMTMIGKGLFPYEETVLEDQVHTGYSVGISHNAYIGSQTVIYDQSQICGNATIGKRVRVSPQAIVSNRIRVGDDANITMGSIVVGNIKSGATVAGNWAIDKDKFSMCHLNKIRMKNK